VAAEVWLELHEEAVLRFVLLSMLTGGGVVYMLATVSF